VGNRLSSVGVPNYNYNSSNELTSSSNGSYTYDNNGNTLTDAQGRSFTWDFENRLVQAVVTGQNGGTTTFRYDPFGRRIQKSGPLGTTNYLYDGDNETEDINLGGSSVARYTQTMLIDEPLAEQRSSTTTYYEADGINSITSLTSATTTISGTYSYDTFGSLSASTGSITNPFQYTAREFDPESGLYFYRARHFDLGTGRFLNEDPLGTGSDDLNSYRYVGNNPLKFMDPWGLCRIHFNGSQIMIETNDGTQRLGPFPATNVTADGFPMISYGVYTFDLPQWLFENGQETALGRSPYDANRDRYQAFGTARIPLEVPGNPGIMIHSRHPDTKNLRPTHGCTRVHDPVVTAFSRFIDAVCTNDGPNTFHYFNSSF